MLLQPTLIIFASFWLTSWPRLFFLSIGYSPICPPCDNEMKTDAMLEHMCASEFGKCSSRPLASARRNLRRRRPHTHTHIHTRAALIRLDMYHNLPVKSEQHPSNPPSSSFKNGPDQTGPLPELVSRQRFSRLKKATCEGFFSFSFWGVWFRCSRPVWVWWRRTMFCD